MKTKAATNKDAVRDAMNRHPRYYFAYQTTIQGQVRDHVVATNTGRSGSIGIHDLGVIAGLKVFAYDSQGRRVIIRGEKSRS